MLEVRKSKWVWVWLTVAGWLAVVLTIVTGIAVVFGLLRHEAAVTQILAILLPLSLASGFKLQAWQMRHVSWTIHSDRIEAEAGFITTDSVSVPIRQIRAVTCRQGLIGRMFDIGNVGVEVAGNFGADLLISTVDRPKHIQNEIQRRMK